MTPNATYLARQTFKTIDQGDQEVTFEAGVQHLAASFDTLVNNVTGEVIKLPLHVARNPSWYFHKVGEFNPTLAPKVSQADYCRELVRGNEGLDFDCLWEMGALEGWLPCQVPPASRNVFSACLSTHPGVQVQLDGVPVRGTKRERGSLKGYTYHAKKAA
jgi:hypothetical protein